jgi:hypothetical protein
MRPLDSRSDRLGIDILERQIVGAARAVEHPWAGMPSCPGAPEA